MSDFWEGLDDLIEGLTDDECTDSAKEFQEKVQKSSKTKKGINGKPETRDGIYRISQELLQVLTCVKLDKNERKIFDTILMYTWGWQYRWAEISLDDFALSTGVTKSNVRRSIKTLLDKNIIKTKESKFHKRKYMYSINKYYMDWKIDGIDIDAIKESRKRMRNAEKDEKLRKY